MTGEAWLTLGIVSLLIVGVARYPQVADVIFLGALSLLTLAGVLTPSEALAGFKNEGMLTVAALFVVAAGLVETGIMSVVARRLLGNVDDAVGALWRIVPTSVAASAFINNTTVVAMGMPALLEWARKRHVAASKLLLPLSYASIIGGVCTLIGTSTNLVVHGLMKQSNLPSLSSGLGMWELAGVGLPIALVSGLWLLFASPRLLPDRKEFLEQLEATRREYLAEVVVEASCPLIGQTVQVAGLRGLPGLFLIEIERGGELISPVAPEEVLRSGDRLTFTGIVRTMVDLQRIPGLKSVADVSYDLDPEHRHGRRLCEAVVSPSSPLIGRGIREAGFRALYDAAVVAVHRNGARVGAKIGDVRLEAGDTLLLQTGPGFARAHRNNPDFFLVSEVAGSAAPRHERGGVALAIAGAMVLLMTLPELFERLPWASPHAPWFEEQRVTFAMLAAGSMVVTRCLSALQARRSLELSVLLAIGASFGVGAAMSKSGAAAAVGHLTIELVPSAWGWLGVLAGVYLLTWLLTELMSNNAAAALMFPVAVSAAQEAGVDPRGFAVVVAVAASVGFILPVGYQTHLMVFGPGGYRVRDFVRMGVPMVVIWFALSMVLIPWLWF
jgi:di/tricarboxylate transporter